MILVAFAAIVGGFLRQAHESTTKEPTIRHDSLDVTRTYDGGMIRWYVFVDPDTQIEYLVNDRGGCCRRERVKEVG